MQIEYVWEHPEELQVCAVRSRVPWGGTWKNWAGWLLSAVIRLFTLDKHGGNYSHIFYRFGPRIWEAGERGVVQDTIDIYRSDKLIVDVYRIDLPKNKDDAILTWLASQVGKPYQYDQLVAIALALRPQWFMRMLDFVGIDDEAFVLADYLRKIDRKDAAFICSELFAYGHLQAGVDVTCGDPIWQVTPDHVAKFAKQDDRCFLRGRLTFTQE